MTDPDQNPDRDARRVRMQALAREIWEAEGRPEGQALRHWAMAERLVEAEERSRAGEGAGANPDDPAN